MTQPQDRPARPARPGRCRYLLAILVSGVVAGLIGIAMAYLLEGFEWLFYGVRDGALPERVAAADTWRRVTAPALGGLLAGALWWWERTTGGVTTVEAVVSDRSGEVAGRMGILRPVADALLQVLVVGSGGSIGREGAPRLAAGAVAARLASRIGLDRDRTATLVAAAAGAGLAAMYNAPLGGAAYAVEIVMIAGAKRRTALVAVPVSVIATLVSWLHSGGRASLAMPVAPLSPTTALACLAVVPVTAGLGTGARALWGWFRAHRLPGGWTLPVGIAAAGLVTGTASLWVTVLPGNGKDAFQAAVLGAEADGGLRASLVVFLAVVLVKPLLTGLTLGAGATGGLLAPSFSLGACAGAAMGVGLAAAGADVSVAAMALVGAGVTLGVTQRAPVFAALFVWEIVHGPVWTLPVLLLACWASERVARPRRRAR